jgi:hypothetical protein
VGVLGRHAVGELVEVRLSDVDVARALQPEDGLGRVSRDVVGKDRRPVGRGQAGGVEEVLDGKCDAPGRKRRGSREEDPVGNYESWR